MMRARSVPIFPVPAMPAAGRIACVIVCLTAVSVLALPARTAEQGGSAPEGKTAFTSPMVLETDFAAADRSLWDPAKGHKPGEWFSTEKYHDLGRFSCDGVYLRDDFSKKKGTWETGLEMSVREMDGGMLKVKVRALADNPDDNKDREVEILFEVLNGDKLLASSSDSTGVEEGDTKDVSVTFTLPASDLVTDPMTKLRLTMKAPRD